uniref:RAB6-interacting golgin n=1 Tax=Ciona savignyi TaxID=51511 RepID=H2Z5N7_CIOSA
MSEWVGFTDEDLHKFQNGDTGIRLNKERPNIAKPVAKKTRQTQVNNRSKQKQSHGSSTQATSNLRKTSNTNQQVPSAAFLSKSINKDSKPKEVQATSKREDKIPVPVAAPMSETTPEAKKCEIEQKADIVIDDAEVKKRDKMKLEDAQQRQKQMEEKNRKKKEMLTKEIAERRKKAVAESSKLVKIQAELTKLDQLLTVDVSILRDQIDAVCWEFSQAQRRFQQAEMEYIAAKVDLHHKTTRKEELTEHLFNIIQANEERKAKKLEELMIQLNMEEEEL